jgi:hypothetical protein
MHVQLLDAVLGLPLALEAEGQYQSARLRRSRATTPRHLVGHPCLVPLAVGIRRAEHVPASQLPSFHHEQHVIARHRKPRRASTSTGMNEFEQHYMYHLRYL